MSEIDLNKVPETDEERDAYIQRLTEMYPALFKEWGLREEYSCMAFGLCIGNGWLPLMFRLLQDLDHVIDNRENSVWLAQVKEKFGTLRVYLNADQSDENGSAKLNRQRLYICERFVSWAEHVSAYTCETCGKRGEMRSQNGWVMVRCDEHKPIDPKMYHLPPSCAPKEEPDDGK